MITDVMDAGSQGHNQPALADFQWVIKSSIARHFCCCWTHWTCLWLQLGDLLLECVAISSSSPPVVICIVDDRVLLVQVASYSVFIYSTSRCRHR